MTTLSPYVMYPVSNHWLLSCGALVLMLSSCSSPSSPPTQADTAPPDFVLTLEETIEESRNTSSDNPFLEAAQDAENNKTKDDTDGDKTSTDDSDESDGTDTSKDESDDNTSANDNPETTDSSESPTDDTVDSVKDETINTLEESLAATQAELEAVREELRDAQTQNSQTTFNAEREDIIAAGIRNTAQPEYKFESCGSLASLANQGWYSDFRSKLNGAAIRFSNGFLEASDMYGGCYSSAGGKAFFIGAQRGGSTEMRIVQYDVNAGTVEQALLVGDAKNVIVNKLGRREGSTIVFTATNGQTLYYYYDANVVMAQ